MLRKMVFAICITITLTSCVTTRRFFIEVNGFGNDASIAEKTYQLWPSNAVAENQLLFDEVKSYVIKIMGEKGYRYIENGNKASLVILLDYGIANSAFVSGNMVTGNSITTYTPQYGTYTRYIKMTAYDLQKYLATKEEKQIWVTSAVSTGSSIDIRLVIPYMLTAMKEYIGKSTGKILEFCLLEGSTEVNSLIGNQ